MKKLMILATIVGLFFALTGCNDDEIEKQIQIEKERQKKVNHMKTKMNAKITNTPIKLP